MIKHLSIHAIFLLGLAAACWSAHPSDKRAYTLCSDLSGGRVSLSTGCQVEWGEKEMGPKCPHLFFLHGPFSACFAFQFSFSPHTSRVPVHRVGEGHKDLDLPRKYCISIRSTCSELPQIECHITAGIVRVWV